MENMRIGAVQRVFLTTATLQHDMTVYLFMTVVYVHVYNFTEHARLFQHEACNLKTHTFPSALTPSCRLRQGHLSNTPNSLTHVSQ